MSLEVVFRPPASTMRAIIERVELLLDALAKSLLFQQMEEHLASRRPQNQSDFRS
jgi:hypothetical protein